MDSRESNRPYQLTSVVNNTEGEVAREGNVDVQNLTRGVENDRYMNLIRSSKVMMVDDEPLTLEVMKIMLEDEGYNDFVVTDTSADAMDLLEKNNPDVVLLDVFMPGVTGFEILEKMRATKEYKHIPVIILTSSTDANTRLKALELGATDFLSKPVDPSELGLRLRNTLAAKAYQDQLTYYDSLTGLPNRRLFIQQAQWAVLNAERNNRSCAFLYIDVDRLKRVNDVLGLLIGDELLCQVSARLNERTRGSDFLGRIGSERGRRPGDERGQYTVSHLGGDEFAILLPEMSLVENAATVGQRLLTAMAEPFKIGGHELYVTLSIGISVFPTDGSDSDTLLKHADVAKQHAKLQGGNNFQFYSKHLNSMSLARLKLENHLRKATARDELQLYYQPKVRTATGELSGVEALLRWDSPELGMVSPATFIPIAEETALIEPIGDWVLRDACRQIKSWQSQGIDVPRVSINVSSHQFSKRNFLSDILLVLEEFSVSAEYLTLELTESTVMEDAEASARVLLQMKEAGLKLSIDDFGTGYSSLSYLKKLPLDELKIDRSFLSDVPNSGEAAAIVRAIIALSHTLGLSVVAEGVETTEQLDFLQCYGCEEFQGYLRSKPLPADQFTERFLLAQERDEQGQEPGEAIAQRAVSG